MRIFLSFHFHNSLLSSIRRSVYYLSSFPIPAFLALTVSLSSVLPLSPMALHLSFYTPSLRSPPSLPCSGKFPITAVSDHSSLFFNSKSFSNGRRSCRSSRASKWLYAVKSSLDTVGPTVGKVTEVDKDTFWPIVNAAGDKAVVLDMYTQWCGPCKVIAPKFQELSEKYLDVVFLKLDCNQENRPLAKELGIRVVPTFKILKDNKVVKEVTGAKFDDLVVAIEAARSS